MKKLLFSFALLLAVSAAAQVVATDEDILGVHNLGVASNPVKGLGSNACLYCHAPHSGQTKGPLWGQTYSGQTYSFYKSDTLQNTSTQPELGKDSSLCLSCHDGTVAPGQLVPSGTTTMYGTMTSILNPADPSKLENSHPFSLKLPLKDSADLVASIFQSQTTADDTQAVKLVKGNVECTSCHNAHVQKIDPASPQFLVRPNKNGDLCKSCHETRQDRTVGDRKNPLALWTTSVHASSAAQVAGSAGLGGYSTVAEFACSSCHSSHDAAPVPGLLRKSTIYSQADATSQSCLKCHDGSKVLVEPIANILAETNKGGHPFASSNNQHSSAEAVLLNDNRHATCVDCHDGHTAKKTDMFDLPPNLRPSQAGASGIRIDGTVLAASAVNQYETCLRCHGASSGKQAPTSFGYLPLRLATGGDRLNVLLQFNTTASAHPVMRDAQHQNQTSLLPNMWDVTGKVQLRTMGNRIYCTDCHNSENNREFGGTGPNGPHGSSNAHILERRYISSQVAAGTWPNGGPGTQIINLNPMTAPYPELDPSAGGPYALCAKCHNLQNSIMANVSFPTHERHIAKGMSCSACHTAHGVPGGAAGLTGERLINFDLQVVAPFQGVLSYSNGTCTLTCHMMDHSSKGVLPSDPAQPR